MPDRIADRSDFNTPELRDLIRDVSEDSEFVAIALEYICEAAATYLTFYDWEVNSLNRNQLREPLLAVRTNIDKSLHKLHIPDEGDIHPDVREKLHELKELTDQRLADIESNKRPRGGKKDAADLLVRNMIQVLDALREAYPDLATNLQPDTKRRSFLYKTLAHITSIDSDNQQISDRQLRDLIKLHTNLADNG